MPLLQLSYDAAIQEYSYTAGTGTYTLAGALSGCLPFSAAPEFSGGATGTYHVTNGSPGVASNMEIATGVYDPGAKTLTRASIVASTNGGAAVNWLTNAQGGARTRLLVRALTKGLPLCATPPNDGDLLTWVTADAAYCPRPPDLDCSIVRVTSGTTGPTLTLTTPITAVIWSSATSGAKSQPLPDPTGKDCKIVHVKMRPSVTGTLTITPVAGMIEGQASIDIQQPDSVMLIADGTADNWDLL